MVKWAMELSGLDIDYVPRTAIKAQALADFVTEMTGSQQPPEETEEKKWMIHVDGSSSYLGSGAGVVLTTPEGDELEYAFRLDFEASNNEAEYEALILGMKIALKAGAKSLTAYSDSQLVVKQVEGEYHAKEARMVKYLKTVEDLKKNFTKMELCQIPGTENMKADYLSKLGGTVADCHSRHITIQSAGRMGKEILQVEEQEDWRTELIRYHENGILPEGKNEKRRMESIAKRFVLLDGVLYKKSFVMPHLRCVSRQEGRAILKEIHEGMCGSHVGGSALAGKTLRAGYFWPTLKEDAVGFAKKCEQCQLHGSVAHQPAEEMRSLSVPCPFARWGMDIVGPLPIAQRQKKFLLVMVDYFTKWVEAEAMAIIDQEHVKVFLWRNIFCRFGIPREIISDNGRQFCGKMLKAWIASFGVSQRFSSVAHPQTNGQVEVTNRILVKGLRTMVENEKEHWVDHLPSVLWSYRTTPTSTTGETPFSMVYGVEAVIPPEITYPSHRIIHFDPGMNEERMEEEMDMIQERRDKAYLRMEQYKQRTMDAHGRRVKPRIFQVGDLVAKKIHAVNKPKKLYPMWEGPLKVTKVIPGGAYMLEDGMGKPLPRPWNVEHLKKFYA